MKNIKLLIWICSILYLAVLCILWAGPYWPQKLYWLANLYQMAPLWVLYYPLGFLFIMALALREKRILAVHILSFAIIIFCIMGFNIPFSAHMRTPGHKPVPSEVEGDTRTQGHLRIMTCNLGGSNVDMGALSGFISRTQPDIIAFQEAGPNDQNALESILTQDKWNLSFQRYLGFASQLKIKTVDAKNRGIPGEWGSLVARYELEWPMGRIYFFNMHLNTPRAGIEAIMDNGLGGLSENRRVAELEDNESNIVSQWIKPHKTVLIAGDFNMLEANPIYKKYWSIFTNAFSKAGFGFGYTKYTSWHGVRIDHLLCDGDWRVIHCETGPDIGSDHRPVAADVKFIGKGKKPALQEAPVDAENSSPIVRPKRIISQVNENIHPCLLFTKDSLPGLKEKFEKSPRWLKDGLLNYADVSPYWKKNEFLAGAADIYDIPSLGFAYQFFGDKDYAEQAIKNMLNNEIKSDMDMENFALGFDWCYRGMTEQDKDIIVDKMERVGLEMMNKKRFFRSFHNTMYQLTTSIAMCGYALRGESDLAQEFIKFAELQYQDAILMFNNIFVDGEWPEGMDYNRHIAVPMVKYFEVVKSAAGKDLYKECDWLLKNAYFVLYATQPDDTFYRFADNDLPEITDWERRFLVRVASYYQDPHIQWYVNNKTRPHSPVFKHIYDVLWYDPFLKEKSPEDLPRGKFFKGLGIVIARSGWDKSATWFSFKCGDYFGDHCHLDENSFTIHKSGDLAIDSGLYGNDFASSHWCNYYSRSIAHNTMSVYSPTERFYGRKMASLANDAGQEIKLWKNGVRMAPENYIDSEPSLPVTWVKNKNKWETGEITAYKSNDSYCYVSGDATKAYDFRKLNNFTRRILFIFPDYFIMLDKAESQRPDFKKKWVLHTVNEPGIKNNEMIIMDKDGRLYCKALYPLNVSINKIGGYGKEFLVNGKIFPHNGELFQGNIPGSWRIEIEPLEPKNEDMFLNVLCASGINGSNAYDIKKIASDNALGASIGLQDLTWVAIFNTGKDGRISYNIENKGRTRNLVFDLTPNKMYEIKHNGMILKSINSDENGILDYEITNVEGVVEIIGGML